jgi:iron(III) transport system permease protein
MPTRSLRRPVDALVGPTGTWVLCITLLLLFLVAPLALVLEQSLQSGGSPGVDAYVTLFSPRFLQPMTNTIVVGAASTFLSLLLSLPLSFVLGCTNMRFRRLVTVLVLVPYLLPAPFLAMAWVSLFIPNGIADQFLGTTGGIPLYGIIPLVVVQTFHLFPLAVTALTGAWASLGADAVGAARVHGAAWATELRSVSLPLITPAVVNAGLLVFAASVAEFGTPLLLASPAGVGVMTTEIYTQLTVFPINIGLSSAMSLVLCVITYITLVGARQLLRSKNYVTVKAGAATSRRFLDLGRWRTPVTAVFGGGLCVLIAVPVLAGVLTSLVHTWGQGYGPVNWSAEAYAYVLWESEQIRSAIVNVVLLGAVAGLAAVGFGYLCAHLSVRERGRPGRWIDNLVFVPYVVPGIVLGIGLVLTFGRSSWIPLAGTFGILFLAYVLRFLPVAYRTESAALSQIDARFEDASRVFGNGWLRATVGIGGRLAWPALVGSWVLVFASVLKEVSASSLLWSPGHEVAPVVAITLFRDGEVQQGVALNLILAFAATVLTLMVRRFDGTGARRRT